MTRTFVRRGVSLLMGMVLAGGLTACGNATDEQFSSLGNGDYSSAEGFQTREFPPAERAEPVVFAGTTDEGGRVASADYVGKVLVVNFWYAGCAPCRVEAEHLESTSNLFDERDVAFLGVNTRDHAATSLSFAENFGVTYPSVLAVDDVEMKLVFAEDVPLSATPTTLVLDKEGRVAARIIGAVNDASVSSFQTIIRDVLAE